MKQNVRISCLQIIVVTNKHFNRDFSEQIGFVWFRHYDDDLKWRHRNKLTYTKVYIL